MLKHIFVAVLLTSLILLSATSADAVNYIVSSDYGADLQAAVDAAGNGGMVIVDRDHTLTEPLILPRFFRLSGMGPQGQATIAYMRADNAAIQFSGPESTSAVVIDNLNIGGLHPWESPGTSVGIAIRGIQHVYLNNVTIRGFDIGIVGRSAFYVHIRDSNVSLNDTYNYHLIDNANSWRITGGSSSQSGTAAIRVETSNNTVIEQVSFESNQIGIHTSTESTHILNNRFECSTDILQFCSGVPLGIAIDVGATQTTLIGNYYSGLLPLVDVSDHGLTHRFDHVGGPILQPPAGAEGLRINLATTGDELVFDADGRLHAGAAIPGSTARLGINAQPGDEALRVGIGGNTSLIVNENGRVGVGTTNPAEPLHVDGNLRLDGDLVTNGVLCIGSGC